MSKIFFIAIFMISLLYGDDKSSTEAFLLKIGITSLVNDFENEKTTIHQNSQDIQQLKQDIKYLMEQNLKLKLKIKDDTNLITSQPTIQKTKNNPNKKFRVGVQKSTLKSSPTSGSQTVGYVYKNDILQIEFCNKFGWCKLQNKQQYIPKYKLKEIK